MTQKKPPFGPRVEVVRKPGAQGTPQPTPRPTPQGAPTPAPTASPPPAPTPKPATPAPAPAPTPRPAVPRPAGPPTRTYAPGDRPSPRPGFGAGPRGPGGPPGQKRSFPPHRPPARPPTVEEINALAKRERVPARIAKGELDGKMKCRIWKKLHAEEAKRFDQAYTLMEKHPQLDLQDAFGIVQSGRTVEEFLQRKARGQLKQEIKQARQALEGDAIDSWLDARKTAKDELAVVLADRTLVDVIGEIHPVAINFERAGRTEKLQIVAMAKKELWDRVSATITRDPKLSRKPIAVQRQPDRRPVADPRAFQSYLGKRLRLELRNGIQIVDTLLSVGPFDVLVGAEGEELFVPLHAMLRWSEAEAAPAE